MDVRVAGHQVDTGETLREHAERRVAEITEKYFSRAVGANVTFGRGPNNDFTCDIVAPVVNGVVLKASYSGREPQIAFNGAADRIEKQLRRYTNRLKEHKVDDSGAGLSSKMRPTRSSRRRPPRRPKRADASDDRRRNSGRHSGSERLRRRDADGSSEHERADVQEQRHGRVQHDLSPRRRKHRLGRAHAATEPCSPIERPSATGRPDHELRPCSLPTSSISTRSRPSLPGGNKRSLLQQLANLAAQRLGVDAAAILASLTEREQLGSTGFGQGVAIPHGKIEGLGRIYCLFARLSEPIDYKAIDGRPVDLVFLLLSPPDAGAEHLKALAAISRVTRNAADARKDARRAQPRCARRCSAGGG